MFVSGRRCQVDVVGGVCAPHSFATQPSPPFASPHLPRLAHSDTAGFLWVDTRKIPDFHPVRNGGVSSGSRAVPAFSSWMIPGWDNLPQTFGVPSETLSAAGVFALPCQREANFLIRIFLRAIFVNIHGPGEERLCKYRRRKKLQGILWF